MLSTPAPVSTGLPVSAMETKLLDWRCRPLLLCALKLACLYIAGAGTRSCVGVAAGAAVSTRVGRACSADLDATAAATLREAPPWLGRLSGREDALYDDARLSRCVVHACKRAISSESGGSLLSFRESSEVLPAKASLARALRPAAGLMVVVVVCQLRPTTCVPRVGEADEEPWLRWECMLPFCSRGGVTQNGVGSARRGDWERALQLLPPKRNAEPMLDSAGVMARGGVARSICCSEARSAPRSAVSDIDRRDGTPAMVRRGDRNDKKQVRCLNQTRQAVRGRSV
jgi:hypothetical protein